MGAEGKAEMEQPDSVGSTDCSSLCVLLQVWLNAGTTSERFKTGSRLHQGSIKSESVQINFHIGYI